MYEWQIYCFPYVELSDVPRLQQVGKKSRTTLSYADDIILVSESEEGLQNGLNERAFFFSGVSDIFIQTFIC
jgi:hypothetical protein